LYIICSIVHIIAKKRSSLKDKIKKLTTIYKHIFITNFNKRSIRKMLNKRNSRSTTIRLLCKNNKNIDKIDCNCLTTIKLFCQNNNNIDKINLNCKEDDKDYNIVINNNNFFKRDLET